MIQNIQPEIYYTEYEPQKPGGKDIVFAFNGKKILAKIDEEKNLLCPTVNEIGNEEILEKMQFLFKISDINYYLFDREINVEGYGYENIARLRGVRQQTMAFAAMTACHLDTWYSSHRFCGKCGHPLEHGKSERVLNCPECGNRAYPVIAPAVIIGVTRGEDILVTRYAGREYKGVALLAGFCEIGESAEDTVRREVMEEVGLKIKNIRYFGSQPWGIDSNLLMGFFAEVDGDDTIHMDENELREAVWMHRSQLKEAKNLASLTMTMIEHFRSEA